MTTPEEIEVGRRNLVAELKQTLRRKDLDEYPLDAQTLRDLVEVLEAVRPVTVDRERLWWFIREVRDSGGLLTTDEVTDRLMMLLRGEGGS